MPSAQYRPLDTGTGRPVQIRGSSHGSKLKALCPKTANIRRVYVCVMLLVMLLVYVVWCLVASYGDDNRADAFATTGKFSTTTTTTPRPESWNLLAVAAPLMLKKLNNENNTNVANFSDSQLNFVNSLSRGLNLSTTIAPAAKTNGSAHDMQSWPSE